LLLHKSHSLALKTQSCHNEKTLCAKKKKKKQKNKKKKKKKKKKKGKQKKGERFQLNDGFEFINSMTKINNGQ
jgi:hypothetical protein